jgi:S-adenosylmethionine:tRNA ribosyltransferase-isomerase
MRLSDLDYELPSQLIAQTPSEPRDASRLLVCRGCAGGPAPVLPFQDAVFRDLPDHLRPGDVLVRNDSRVLAARTHFLRATGGRLELLFLGERTDGRGEDVWEVLMRGRPRVGERLECEDDRAWCVQVLEDLDEGRWLVRSRHEDGSEADVCDLLSRNGEMPLPPYIRQRLDDPQRYQTTYCRVTGSAAAPTAGLHFTQALDDSLERAGVQIEALTLHVGLGTFKPLSVDRLDDVRLHAERFQVPGATWERITAAKTEGRRVIAVGTTVVRVLEHLALSHQTRGDEPGPSRGPHLVAAEDEVRSGETRLLTGTTGLFISPGYRFQVVDGMITNFHLPRTSLLALVMAFCGVERTRALYRHAVVEGYRFYSFGDAMLAL